MRFVALAVDYDGTIAKDGRVEASTVEALRKVRESGRKLILVTGRDLDDLIIAFPEIAVFDLVVAENGGLLYDPAMRRETVLTEAPPIEFIQRLQDEGVAPLTIGRSIVSTWEPNEVAVLAAIRDLGLDRQIIFNKGAVMVLPSGVDKASGLGAALKQLGLSPLSVVGVGDAENDLPFLRVCGAAASVANALPSVREACDFGVADHGVGVEDLCSQLMETDLADVGARLEQVQPIIGMRDGRPERIGSRDALLVAGLSGAGKSTTVTALLEQMAAAQLQYCVIDPEGDYDALPNAVVLGGAKQEPDVGEVLDLLAKPDINVVVNMLAIEPRERPPAAAKLLRELATLRSGSGRPHWIVIDEAHHCLPREWEAAQLALPQSYPGVVAVTVHPEAMASDFVRLVTMMVGVGKGAETVLAEFCELAEVAGPPSDFKIEQDEGAVMRRDGSLTRITTLKPKERQRRHIRKYAVGELGDDKCFYFRGPKAELNLRAYNLASFVDLGRGVDDATWLFHLVEGHYSKWVREEIKDDELADEIAAIERQDAINADDSRALIKEMIDKRYTAPAKAPRADRAGA